MPNVLPSLEVVFDGKWFMCIMEMHFANKSRMSVQKKSRDFAPWDLTNMILLHSI